MKRRNGPIRVCIHLEMFKFLNKDYGIRNMLLIITRIHQMSQSRKMVGDEEFCYGAISVQESSFFLLLSLFFLSFILGSKTKLSPFQYTNLRKEADWHWSLMYSPQSASSMVVLMFYHGLPEASKSIVMPSLLIKFIFNF